MRKIVLFLCMIAMNCMCSYAQQHLKVLGISMNMDVDDFVVELQKKGFTYLEKASEEAGQPILKGHIYDENANLVVISETEETHVVSEITFQIPCASRAELERKYYAILEKIKADYDIALSKIERNESKKENNMKLKDKNMISLCAHYGGTVLLIDCTDRINFNKKEGEYAESQTTLEELHPELEW